MIDLETTFEDMKEEINFIDYLLDETISPKANSEKFVGFDGLGYLSKNNLSLRDARCLSWKYFSEAFGNMAEGTDINYYFNELQYNSFMHGNKWNKELPVHIIAGYGEKGFAAQIEDSGEGFDYKKVYSKYLSEKKYFKNKGSGFNKFNERNSYIISWEGKGNISNLMFRINENDEWIWKDRILHLSRLTNKFINFKIKLKE